MDSSSAMRFIFLVPFAIAVILLIAQLVVLFLKRDNDKSENQDSAEK
ncbi:MAG: hypothetical protein WCO51_09020 [bacterium]|jgi:hypothetical protein